MLTKFVLVAIFFTPDFSQYRDFVGSFATEAECQKAKVEFVQNLKRGAVPKEFHYVASCVKPRGVSDMDS